MTRPGREPDAARLALLRSSFEAAPLVEVAEAVSIATETEREIYVEHIEGGWRWSFAHRGGAYPLLRITARFLDVEHDAIQIAFRTTPHGYAVICRDPAESAVPTASAILTFDAPATADDVAARMRALD